MLERIRDAVALRRRARDPRSPSSASTGRAPTSTSSGRPTRPRSRRARRRSVVVDTLGIATPEAVAELVGRTREWLGPDVPLHFHGHNDFGLATAAAVAAVRAGATWIQGTINGMGERGRQREPDRGRARARRALRRRDEPPARPGPRGLRGASASSPATSSSRGSRSSARTSSAARAARSPASSTTRRRSSRTRPSSSAPSAAIVLGKKSGSTRSGSSASELGLDVPEERAPELLAR